MNQGESPTVSVVLRTYNHERYVRQAIDSVLAQQAPFGIELLITEDCSTDGTRAIVEAVAAENPHRVRLFLSARNQNDQDVFTRAWRAVRAPYVAYLDGDDWWTSPHKLQLQVEQLQRSPELSAVFHAALVVDADGAPLREARYGAEALTREAVLAWNLVKSPTVLFRREALGELPPWFDAAPYTDWPLYVIATGWGPMGYLDEPLAAYRKHRGGAWSGARASERHRTDADFFALVLPALSRRSRRQARALRAGSLASLARARFEERDRWGAAAALASSWRASPLRSRRTGPSTSRFPRARTVAGALRAAVRADI